MLAVKLGKSDGGLRALSAELKPRADSDDDEGWFQEVTGRTRATKRAPLPDGTEPCDIGAWSEAPRSQGAATSAPSPR